MNADEQAREDAALDEAILAAFNKAFPLPPGCPSRPIELVSMFDRVNYRAGLLAGEIKGMRRAADIVGHSDASAINAVADQLEGQQ